MLEELFEKAARLKAKLESFERSEEAGALRGSYIGYPLRLATLLKFLHDGILHTPYSPACSLV